MEMADMKTQDLKKYNGIRWQVMFSFLLSWLCHSVSGQLHYSIPEEMRKDSIIANIANDLGLDVQQLTVRKFRMVSRFSDKYFAINLENGNLYVIDRIDRETLCGAEVTCFLAFDAVVENPLNIVKVNIEIQDINDNSPIFFHSIIALEIVETTSTGTHFILQNAEDPDIGVNCVQTYKLSKNNHFELSEKTKAYGSKYPELVLEKALDRETQNIHELTLTAFDGGNPVKSGTALIKITIADANDNSPVFLQEIYKVSISENIPINSTVLFVTAADQDEGINAQVMYSFIQTSGNTFDTDFFKIDATSGEIKTNKMLDFEKRNNYEISVQAKDRGGLVHQTKVLVEITDENDNVPEIFITSFSNPIPEDSAPGTLIALIEVHDQDSGENAEVDCVIIEKASFQLIMSSSRYYRIVTASVLDRENASRHNITIRATDMGSPPLSSSKIVTLDILDVNDNPPVFAESTYLAYVPENNLPGASIHKIHATDIDFGDNARVIYSITSSNSEDFPVSPYLSINKETGVLYAQRSFDYEHHKAYQIQILAEDNGSPPLSSNATLNIYIVDQNDNAPRILYPSTESGSVLFEIVPMASEQGSLVTKVIAVDADSGHNAWLSYYFLHMSEPFPFSISKHSGEIRTLHAFEEKDALKHKVVVMVKDNGEPSLSATVTLSLIVADNYQQVVPNLSNEFAYEDSTSDLPMYLVIALALISFLFILSVMLVIVSKCKESRSLRSGSLSTNLYSQVDPRMFSQYNNGTLTLPYSYNVCVALDSSENDFTFIKPNQDVPIDNLIDADDPGLRNENAKETLSSCNLVEQAQPNTDWRFSQAQRPGPSGAQPTEEAGVWPNNQFETERLQAMILASANEAAEGSSALGGGTGTMGLSARYGPQFTLQHVPDYRQNIYIPGTTSTLTNAAGKRDGKAAAPSGGNKKKSGKKDKK
ncbi:protocadherin gamma-B5-like isoform X2 [Spea bombifrons]|uniref:protocadherin gamma-B5-like isoform X2 n=1 Tax=Spea bombifrons TaxID=233779 RepID=UPI00234BD888|nr:protocadherin gamma-B5-like isoform X2 [Spea bombifrons]